MPIINNVYKRAQLEALAALLADVPEEKRDIVAAQVIGTINGAILAAQIERGKQSA